MASARLIAQKVSPSPVCAEQTRMRALRESFSPCLPASLNRTCLFMLQNSYAPLLTGLPRKPKGGQYAWLGKIGVNEQDLNILLRRHGKRQVDSAEGLALARMRRANQNAFAARKFLAVPAWCAQQQLPLDDAELL